MKPIASPFRRATRSRRGCWPNAGYRRGAKRREDDAALGSLPAVPAPPPGISLDVLDVASDGPAVHAADTAAFADNPDYEPESFSAFYDEHLDTPELDPSLSRVARRCDAVAGFTLCRRQGSGIGYVDLLAVQKSERGRATGDGLLLAAFAAFAEAGLHEARLEVAWDNPGAFRIYERAGMAPGDRVEVFEKPVAHPTATGWTGLVK